jgi:hypothetical protein
MGFCCCPRHVHVHRFASVLTVFTLSSSLPFFFPFVAVAERRSGTVMGARQSSKRAPASPSDSSADKGKGPMPARVAAAVVESKSGGSPPAGPAGPAARVKALSDQLSRALDQLTAANSVDHRQTRHPSKRYAPLRRFSCRLPVDTDNAHAMPTPARVVQFLWRVSSILINSIIRLVHVT